MKNRTYYLVAFFLCLSALSIRAQELSYERENWVKQAEAIKPALNETIVKPVCLVEMVEDGNSFQGWKAVPVGSLDSLFSNSFRQSNTVIVDFGDHFTGYFSMDIETLWGTSDAPTRFKLTFGEVPAELAVPFDPYAGELSRAWLQDEIITVMSIPAKVKLERRVSFRYVKIELLGASKYFDFKIADMHFTSTTSAMNEPPELNAAASEQIRKIDKISRNTLKECMQTVYEDGPKRDRRLWVGDLYLESLANIYTFENHQLTKRCLYLLAGLSDHEGYVLGTVFETPEPHAQAGQRLMDYSLLYNATLCEYLKATNDRETAVELWPVALTQLGIIDKYVDENGNVDYEAASEWWLFFDWKDGLDKEASIQGLMIFVLKQTYELAKLINKEKEVSYIPSQIKKMSKAAIKNLYNKDSGLFESGKERQISYASQIWMILGGVLSEKQSQKALTEVAADPDALFPGGPYLYHYYIQALVNTEMYETAKASLLEYWGGMAEKGADTFWEVYDPDNDYLSPYKFYPINSYCHAWSCTPTYFIRKYPDVFQK